MYRIYHGLFCNQMKKSDNSSAGKDVYTLYMCRLRLIDKSTEQTTKLNQTLTKKKLQNSIKISNRFCYDVNYSSIHKSRPYIICNTYTHYIAIGINIHKTKISSTDTALMIQELEYNESFKIYFNDRTARMSNNL